MNDAIQIQQNTLALPADKIDLIKRTVCKGASNEELQLFLHAAQRMGLDPIARQIHAVKRWDSQAGREVMNIQVAIDGFRLIAQRTGAVDGQDGPFWCGEDGIWRDVWLDDEPPRAAKVIVYRKGEGHPYSGIARLDSYAQRKKDGSFTAMWSKMPDVMLAKCAEALALRKAFPAELSGAYSDDEMSQADNEPIRANSRPQAQPTPSLPSNAPTAEEPPYVFKSGRQQGKSIHDVPTHYLQELLKTNHSNQMLKRRCADELHRRDQPDYIARKLQESLDVMRDPSMDVGDADPAGLGPDAPNSDGEPT